MIKSGGSLKAEKRIFTVKASKMEAKWGILTEKTAKNNSKYSTSLDEKQKKMYYL